VVGFAPGCRCGAVFGAAVLVAQSHGFALRRAVEAAGAAEVKVFEESAEGLAEESVVRDPVLLAAERLGLLPG
jgi:hypothetical protein